MAWLLLVVAVLGSGVGKREIFSSVDMIELNHFHDDLGRPAYDQIILYEWSPDYRRFHVIGWYLIENDPNREPVKVGEAYVARWRDRDGGVSRVIRSKIYRETWGQTDPERHNKKLLDEKFRSSLPNPYRKPQPWEQQ